ncbi:hypothetical protein D3C78_803650 [compost metagenome]
MRLTIEANVSPAADETFTGMVLMNKPTISSTPTTSSGLPDTTVPNTTSLDRLYI